MTISRILIIDDNESIHEDFRKVFASDVDPATTEAAMAFLGEAAQTERAAEYEIECVAQGELGLAALNDAIAAGRPFDMAFVDMRMPPGWDGVETIQHLWNADPFLEVVICSAYSDYSWSGIVEKLGLSDRYLIIRKPFDNVEVLQAAASLCEKRRLNRENAAYRRDLEKKVQEQTQSLQEALTNLTESRQFLRSSLDAMPVGIGILSESGKLLLHNRAWDESDSPLVAHSGESATNYLRFCDAHRGELEITAKLVGAAIREVINGQRDSFLREYRQLSDGTQSWFTVRVDPFEEARPGRVVITHENITEKKLLEAQLSQAKKFQSIGELAAGLASEIGGDKPTDGDDLKFVESRSEKLLELVGVALQFGDTETHGESLQSLQTELRSEVATPASSPRPIVSADAKDQVSRIVRAVEGLSQVGREDRSRIDINDVLETAAMLSSHEWKEVAELEMHLEPTLPLIEGLSGELSQVFLSLIVNAAHAISEQYKGNGKIDIRSFRAGTSVRVEIADNGGGIPPEIQGRVFDPFFSTKDPSKASGHGLAIALGVITRKHNGRISFDVDPSVGTTFIVELPVMDSHSDGTIDAAARTATQG